MNSLLKPGFHLAAVLALGCGLAVAAEPLTVASDFEGASVAAVEIDNATRSVSFTPGGDPKRGWPCWWYLRVNGITPGETITLRLRSSSSWAMPEQATFSTDGKTWLHTGKGTRQAGAILYTVQPDAASVFVAWGPPYTPATAAAFIRELSGKSTHAKAGELTRSRENRPVPMLHIQEGPRPKLQRFGIWLQARQHAWECGSSWVAQGFAEWLLSDHADAAWLRQHAEIFIIPVMDVDNTATGNGGKEAVPQDHNRDWLPEPHWKETIAAQRMVNALTAEGRMDVFLDLHNPGHRDSTFFYALPEELLKPDAVPLLDRFVTLATAAIATAKPPIPLNRKPNRGTGPNFNKKWAQVSTNWVNLNGNPHTVSLCLETMWNHPNSTTEGYRAVGASLAQSVREYLAERPGKQ